MAAIAAGLFARHLDVQIGEDGTGDMAFPIHSLPFRDVHQVMTAVEYHPSRIVQMCGQFSG